MRRGYETAHVSSPVSNLVQGMSIVDENRPKKSLTDIISNYQARVRGMMSGPHSESGESRGRPNTTPTS